MANTNPTLAYPLACIGARVRHFGLALGIIESHWALLAHMGWLKGGGGGVVMGSARVFGYQHVVIGNAKVSL